MNFKEIYKDKDFGSILFDADLKDYTTFGIGGPGDCLIFPNDEDDLGRLIRFNYENKIPTIVIGRGSNLLVSDKGVRGCIIILSDNYGKIDVDGEYLTAMAGAKLKTCMEIALRNSLTGLEEISGIPGSVGGAASMNAGAYNKEMKDVVYEVRTFNLKGEAKTFRADQMNYSYRHSIVFEKNLIVSSVKFKLKKGDYNQIAAKFKDYTDRRASKQPLDKKSAGSTFKRPKGSYASKLIDECGLRGFRVGDCQVSEKHCGFIINVDQASCKDMVDFIKQVKKIVEDKTGFVLEREVKLIGDF